ncbi:MAG TPA: hypothetical protein VFV77_10170, partial [Gammaproteobacteria bacterium]|nr:hypothetical protein [Gammaproteobacteria bacterium]
MVSPSYRAPASSRASMSADYRYIDTPTGLAELCSLLRDKPWIAVDTEFMRERTYYPELCLVQVAT